MKYVRKAALAASAFGCAALFSLSWVEQGGISLSVESAQARVGRPLTPVSVAGVARRHNRRAAYYGAGAVAASVAAVGTGAAIAATAAPNAWGNNNWGDAYATQVDPQFGQPHYVHRAYYGHSPYYGYSGWDHYSARNNIKCTPGGMTKLDDGQMYFCRSEFHLRIAKEAAFSAASFSDLFRRRCVWCLHVSALECSSHYALRQ